MNEKINNKGGHMKLVVADLDGTLVHKKVVSDASIKTIKQLKEQGFLFTIATGRHMDATREIAQLLEVDLPVICGNGAIIYDFDQDQILHQELLSDDILNQIIDLCFKNQLNFLMYTTKHVVTTKQAATMIHEKIGKFDIHIIEENEIKNYFQIGVFKILVIDEDIEKLRKLKNQLSSYQDISMVQSQPFFLDIGHRLSNKGRAISKLVDILNIDIKDVLAIGDQENDIDMIKTAGIGVAMGDSHLELKRVADDITETYQNDGFTQAINKHVFKK